MRQVNLPTVSGFEAHQREMTEFRRSKLVDAFEDATSVPSRMLQQAQSWRRIEGGGARYDQQRVTTSQRGLTRLTFQSAHGTPFTV